MIFSSFSSLFTSPISLPYAPPLMDPGPDPQPYAPLPATATPTAARRSARLCQLAAGATVALLLVALLAAAGHTQTPERWAPRSVPQTVPVYRGVLEGVSEKSTEASYPWTNAMLAWQRTVFHFQPQKNWMNDPDGPLFYKGWYHLFYQYNPDSAVWGNITWGHAVSRDLVHWLYLPLALVPDRWYDANGVWTGSATLLPSGSSSGPHIVILYTGSTNGSVQVQNLAVPADPSDPLLVHWAKSDSNPVLLPPPGIGPKDFRDPTTAWFVPARSAWWIAIGSKNDSAHTGLALVYETRDFINYTLLPGPLHEVAGTGMWECVDFYPIPTREGVKHVLKASLDDVKHDYYAIGAYEVERDAWVPGDVEADVGVGLRVDYGKYYASKTFYDEVKERRVLFGWAGETDSERTDLLKGWASVQTIPRTVLYDEKTERNLLLWPVEEVESLRLSSQNFSNISLAAGAVLPHHVPEAVQLDITAVFEIESSALAEVVEADVGYNCSTSGGAASRGALGPFGLLVLADEDRTEQTAVYFYVGRGIDGGLRTFFCQDELRSSKANDLVKRVYGSTVPVLHGENLAVRILVDHSIVESFAQGGRTCITSRVYPTKAIYGAARVFLFNNATGARVIAKFVEIWQMNSAFIGPYTPEVVAQA